MRRLSRSTRLVGLAALAGVLYYAVTLFQVWSTGRDDSAIRSDAIVVLGAAQYDGRPSPQLAARLDHALELYRSGVAPLLVVTGGKQPADRVTEAEASRDYLVERGVPEAAIALEARGRTTFESLRNAADLLAGRIRSVIVVTDPYYILRSSLIAEDVGFSVTASPTDRSSGAGRYLGEAGGVAVGRIIGWKRLADLVG